ncbi:MAG: thiol:disulfide interchange protein [Campylobacteraceae bacterium]|nr:thiol:disulfide interchange protein [Campylobacteraceae bacterium]
MKRIIVLLFLFFIFRALAFDENEDYIKLISPLSNANKTLIKVFNYECSFCYKYEKELTPSMVRQTEDILTFRPFHMKRKGKYGKEASELFAVLMVKDMQDGIDDFMSDKSLFRKAQMAYYNVYYTKKGIKEESANDFLSIGFKVSGISEYEFNNLKSSPQVQDILKSWDLQYEVVKFKDAPIYIVNGKYLIKTQTIKSMGAFVDLVRELANR